MRDSLIDSLVNWGWMPRILVSGFLVFLTALNFIYYGDLWAFGLVIPVLLLVTPFIMREKFVEYDDTNTEVTEKRECLLERAELEELLLELGPFIKSGFDQSRMEMLLSQVDRFELGQHRVFNYHIMTEGDDSSLLIKVSLTGADELTVVFTARPYFCGIIDSLMEDDEA